MGNRRSHRHSGMRRAVPLPKTGARAGRIGRAGNLRSGGGQYRGGLYRRFSGLNLFTGIACIVLGIPGVITMLVVKLIMNV